MKKIKFMDTSFRDGFQSYFGARVLTKDFIPAVEAAASAGINHFEAGGGARFQSLPLYCNESPFDMMDAFRKAAGKDAKLQTLARGINVVALSARPRDMIDLHTKTFKNHGITHIRNFDALNDVGNLEYSANSITKNGLHHQVCVTMMELPPGCSGAHDVDFYISTLRKILDAGVPFDSICFKDASGTSSPQKVYETVRRARELVGKDTMLWMHTHSTAGIGELQYMAAIKADIDGICLSRSPVAGGTAQPGVLTMNHALKGYKYTLDIDYKKILQANAVFKECMKDYFFPPEAQKVSPEVILSPMPGGALTANTMMMRDTDTLHLYPKVIEEMSEVVAKGGFGTSVTPMSQFYFQQAYTNTTLGRWKKITDGYGKTVLGYFGKTPVAPAPEIIKLASEQLGLPQFNGNPLDKLAPGIPVAKALLEKEGLEVSEDNLFIVGALATPGGNKGIEFLKGNAKVAVRKGDGVATPKSSSSDEIKSYTVNVEGKNYAVSVIEGSGEITSLKEATPANSTVATGVEVKAKLPGNVLKIVTSKGVQVKKGDTIVILEAMKMETPVVAPQDGTVSQIFVKTGEMVKASQLLLTLS